MPGITIINKCVIPINVVVLHSLAGVTVGFGRHMKIAPGARVELDLGVSKVIQQFKVYVWGGGERTAITENKVALFLLARLIASAVTSSMLDDIVGYVTETIVDDVCQEFVLNHIESEVITSQAFEEVVGKSVDMVLDNLVDHAIQPKEWGVCSEFFWTAARDNVRYVYGGPTIHNGKLMDGGKIYMSKNDTGFDPLKNLTQFEQMDTGSQGRDNTTTQEVGEQSIYEAVSLLPLLRLDDKMHNALRAHLEGNKSMPPDC
jgi:hypothetical protein